jgi:hypothetical protein
VSEPDRYTRNREALDAAERRKRDEVLAAVAELSRLTTLREVGDLTDVDGVVVWWAIRCKADALEHGVLDVVHVEVCHDPPYRPVGCDLYWTPLLRVRRAP